MEFGAFSSSMYHALLSSLLKSVPNELLEDSASNDESQNMLRKPAMTKPSQLLLDMQVWKLSESLDSMESLMTATSALNENSSTPSSQEGNPTLNNF
jgi:hypothetical protein